MFGSSDAAILTDNNNNAYKRIAVTPDFDSKYSQAETSIYPNDTFSDLLVFERPVANNQWLHLELPAKNFGGSGLIRFEIPSSKISHE